MAKTLIKFGTVGGFGVLWKTIFLLIFVELISLSETIAIYPTALIVLIHNYELNRRWTFNNAKRSWLNFFQYGMANGLSLGIYFGAYLILLTTFYYLIASWIAVLFAAGINFLTAHWIFSIRKPKFEDEELQKIYNENLELLKDGLDGKGRKIILQQLKEQEIKME